MIQIDLKLYVTLSKYHPSDGDAYRTEPGTTIGKLIEDLNIPDTLVKLIFINGVRKNREYQLKDKDRVGLFPPVGGG